MQKKDPTEDVMAAIARIVENPAFKRAAPSQSQPQTSQTAPEPVAPSAATQALTSTADDGVQPLGAHGYSRLGPGPLPALRFKWTARREASSGDYYVDETIGDYSRPVTTGPMTGEEAVALVDKRVKDSRERFDRLKADMSVRAPDDEAEVAVEADAPADQKPEA